MNGYKMNFETKTLTITKAFEENLIAGKADEVQIVNNLREIVPDLHIQYKTHKSPNKPNRSKGLTYKKMENYIKLYDNSSELLKRFEIVKALSPIQKNPYLYVFNWFIMQFPKYNEMPEFIDGKLYASPIDLPEVTEMKIAA